LIRTPPKLLALELSDRYLPCLQLAAAADQPWINTVRDSVLQWHGSSEVAEFMHSMSDGQIAGGDTDRSVALNQIRPKAEGKGVDFSLTVQQNSAPRQRHAS
jgi:hypothetical protein